VKMVDSLSIYHKLSPIGGDRINEGHVAVRFGDCQQDGIMILLDGEDITHSVNEAVPGLPGVVVAINQTVFAAPNPWDPWVLVFGNVEVRQVIAKDKQS